MRYSLIPILALSLAVPAMAQTPAEALPAPEPTSEYTSALPESVPDLGAFASMDFRRILTITQVSPENGSLHKQLLASGICVQGQECMFMIHATLYQEPEAKPATMAVRYVLLNKNGRAEGLALSRTESRVNRYWHLVGASWTEYDKDSPQYRAEEQFIAGTWDFVVKNQK